MKKDSSKQAERLLSDLARAYRRGETREPDPGFSARVMNRLRVQKTRNIVLSREPAPGLFPFRLLPVAAGTSCAAVFALCFVAAAVSWWPEGIVRWLMPDGIGVVLFQSGIF
ncbi:MAG: hypothetical protein AB1921_15685 [Thermodesulfobacteriota bacterium]